MICHNIGLSQYRIVTISDGHNIRLSLQLQDAKESRKNKSAKGGAASDAATEGGVDIRPLPIIS